MRLRSKPHRLTILLLITVITYGTAHGQNFSQDTAKVNALLLQSKEQFSQDLSVAKQLAEQAKVLSNKIGYKKGEAQALKNIGTVLFIQQNTSAGLALWEGALTIFEEIHDSIGIADMLGNIGIYHYKKGDNVAAIDYYLKSLKIAESIGYKKVMLSALNNIGGIYYYNTSTYDKALKYYLQAQPIAEELDDPNGGFIALNIGNIYQKKKDFDRAFSYLTKATELFKSNPANLAGAYHSLGTLYFEKGNDNAALQYYSKAYDLASKYEVKADLVQSALGFSKVYLKWKQPKEALKYLLQAEKVSKETESTVDASNVYDKISEAYKQLGDFKQAYTYQEKYAILKDTLYNAEYDKKVATLQFDFELEKKEGEITLLTKDKQLKEADLKRQKLAKNAFMLGLLLIMLIAVIIFRNYKHKVKVNKILDRQKGEIEHLLHNILPVEVAKELQTTGKATPKSFDSVSVLFTDFKGFTVLADKLSPEELVEELNSCFSAFDSIVEKHGLEKIKTIGDSFMCAGGIPLPSEDHPMRMVKAALEIQQYIADNNARREALGLATWEIRIGVHVGPLVAGVVGKKKYAYDIWGSTVNIASRMESSGIPGKVNISSSTFELIKHQYACMYRGKVYAKNVGDVDMYLVESEIDSNVKFIPADGASVQKVVVIPG